MMPEQSTSARDHDRHREQADHDVRPERPAPPASLLAFPTHPLDRIRTRDERNFHQGLAPVATDLTPWREPLETDFAATVGTRKSPVHPPSPIRRSRVRSSASARYSVRKPSTKRFSVPGS